MEPTEKMIFMAINKAHKIAPLDFTIEQFKNLVLFLMYAPI